jgi:hypothetical protein
MSRTTLWALRIVALCAFIGFIVVILINTDSQVWRLDGGAGVFTTLVEFAMETRNVITLIFSILIAIAATVGSLFAGYFFQVPPITFYQAHTTAVGAYFQALGFTLSRPGDTVIPYFLSSLYFLGFQLLLLVALISGILSFLRVSGRLSSICFISMMGIAVLGAAGSVLSLPGITTGYFGLGWSNTIPTGPVFAFFGSSIFLVAMVCYIYLEASYQVVYFYELLEPPTVREEQLRRQLSQLQSDARGTVPSERQDIPIPKALQRMLGSDAFRLMRQVIERKLLRKEWVVELKDSHEIRRLNSFVERLFQVDPEAEQTLTARAATPSFSKMVTLSIISTIIRFTIIILIAFISFFPIIFLQYFAPPIIIDSVDFLFLPERTLILLLPLSLLFPLAATIIGHLRHRRVQKAEDVTTLSQQ